MDTGLIIVGLGIVAVVVSIVWFMSTRQDTKKIEGIVLETSQLYKNLLNLNEKYVHKFDDTIAKKYKYRPTLESKVGLDNFSFTDYLTNVISEKESYFESLFQKTKRNSSLWGEYQREYKSIERYATDEEIKVLKQKINPVTYRKFETIHFAMGKLEAPVTQISVLVQPTYTNDVNHYQKNRLFRHDEVYNCLQSVIEKRKERVVLETSLLYKNLVNLNKKYKFDNTICAKYKYEPIYDSKQRLEKWDIFFNFLDELLSEKQRDFESIFQKAQHNSELWDKYQKEYKSIAKHTTDEEINALNLKIKPETYRKYEIKLFEKGKLEAPVTQISVFIHATYTSPSGRNHYWRDNVFTHDEVYNRLQYVKEKRELEIIVAEEKEQERETRKKQSLFKKEIAEFEKETAEFEKKWQMVVKKEKANESAIKSNRLKIDIRKELGANREFILKHGNFVAFDIETTGLNPETDEIIEIAGVKVINGEDAGEFQELIKPVGVISSEITAINGITNDMVKNCRSIKEVLSDFLVFTEGLPLVAHNAKFDYSFLEVAVMRNKGETFNQLYFCTAKLHRLLKREGIIDSYSTMLEDVAADVLEDKEYNQYLEGAHRALTDARTVRHIYLPLLYAKETRVRGESIKEKNTTAQKQLEILKKMEVDICPVIVEGKTIAKSWWGNEWIETFENYVLDDSNRLRRGRSYVRNGFILDLKIEGSKVCALVSGSMDTPYCVMVNIKPFSKNKIAVLAKHCNNKISELEELIDGNFSQALADLLEQSEESLFPVSSEICFSCSCPDAHVIYPCKHVYAVLYAIGAWFDSDPTLFFKLRGIDFKRFLSK